MQKAKQKENASYSRGQKKNFFHVYIKTFVILTCRNSYFHRL